MSIERENQLIFKLVKKQCDMLNLLNPNKPIHRSVIFRLWSKAGKELKIRKKLSNDLVTNAMQEWATEHNRQLLSDDGPDNTQINMRIV